MLRILGRDDVSKQEMFKEIEVKIITQKIAPVELNADRTCWKEDIRSEKGVNYWTSLIERMEKKVLDMSKFI